MIRRYSFRRSDNFPFVGEETVLLNGSGTTKVTTGSPITSAIVSHAKTMPSSSLKIVSQNVNEHDLEAVGSSNPLQVLFSRESPVIIHSMGIDFSRGNVLRQYSMSVS